MLIGASCSESNTGFLEPDTSNDLTNEIVFADSAYTYEYQAKLYRDVAFTYFADNGMYAGGLWSWSDLSDDSKQKFTGASQIAHFYNMNMIPNADWGRTKEHWKNCYANIFRVNVLLASIDKGPLSMSKKDQFKAESRFLRAWYYFHLLRLYGGVPLLGDKVYSISEKVEETRSNFSDVVDYIVSEMNDVAKILPAQQTGQDYGRPTSGAALAAKSRVLLFAASPLSNGKIPTDDPQLRPLLGYDSYSIERWKEAAVAAKDVMDLNRYSLVEDNETESGHGFYEMMNQRVNPEYIFMLMKRNYKYYEAMLLPNSRGGQTYSSPFQSLVDAFLTIDGKMITDPNSKYDSDHPYENRDPRFNYSILYDGAMWIPKSGSSVKERVNLYFGAASDGLGTSGTGSTKTGYLFRKFCNENVTGGSNNNDNVSPFIRYAEILLNYAEAINESDPTGGKNKIEDALFKIRKRAGIREGSDNRYGLPTIYNQAKMREIIHNERRIEFAFEEGHRFFDLKRWGELEAVKNNVRFYGIKWSNPDEGPQKWEPYFVEKQIFASPKQYYFPIPLSEINIIGPDFLIQNPGW